jgi:transposase InsO family protein
MLCSKRLVPFLPELIEILEAKGHLQLSVTVRQKLTSISAATVDRLLKKERKSHNHSLSLTRAGNFLKKQIPIRTFTEWNDVTPGFFEVDLVAHCGGDVRGQFIQTLTMTDISTQWTECVAVLCKGELEVIAAIDSILPLLPFELKGIDSDNGSEFINYKLVNWCAERSVTFTRSRQYKKNDQAHVEERNGSVVRRLVGYQRLEGIAAFDKLRQLQACARLYINFFQPSQKLLVKSRNGSKVYRRYDHAKTPYNRIIDSNQVNDTNKSALRVQYAELDPVLLFQQLKQLQLELGGLSTPTAASLELEKQKRILETIKQDSLALNKPPSPVSSKRSRTVTVRQRILALEHGTIIKANEFRHLHNRDAIHSALKAMVKRGEVIRIARGIYHRGLINISLTEFNVESQKLNEATVGQ